jgi:glycosyltransferase involved in cell wall biosynthesis
MKIALNAWFLDQPTTGSGQYLARLLAEYAVHSAGHHFLICGHTGQGQPNLPAASPPVFEWQTLHTPFGSSPSSGRQSSNLGRHLAKLWFEQVSFVHACHAWGADLIHVPYWASPLVCRIPTVVTVHDLIPLLVPAYQAGRLGKWYTRLVTLSAWRATHVITDSQASRQDIITHLHIPPERVEAILLAASERFLPAQAPEALQQVRTKYGLPARYLLYLGGFDVRKNVPAILRAYARLNIPDVSLVIAGKLPTQDTAFTPHPQRIADELGISEHVHLTGWVDEEDKPALYSLATALVFPSHYEGFGLPPLEAMSCGTPAIGSDRSSLPEVIGSGGLCVAPDDIDALTQAMRRLCTDEQLHESLARAALDQAARFNWSQTACATLAAYERIHANKKG